MSKHKELKKRYGATRESSRPFWKPSPVRAALVCCFFGNSFERAEELGFLVMQVLNKAKSIVQTRASQMEPKLTKAQTVKKFSESAVKKLKNSAKTQVSWFKKKVTCAQSLP